MRWIVLLILIIFSNVYPQTLDDLINLALKNNPQLKKLEKELSVLKEKSETAKKLPNPSFSLSYSGGVNVSMRQYIPWYEKLELSKEIEKQNYSSQIYIYELEKNKLIRQVKEDAYRIKVYKDKVELLEKYQNDVKNLINTKKEDYELNKLKILYTEIELEKLSYLKEIESLISHLKEVVNSDIKGVEVEEINFREDLNIEIILKEAEKQSPVLKSLEETLKRDRFAYKLAKEIYYPDVSIGTTYKSKERFQDAFSVSVNLNLNFPFWRTLHQEQIVLERKLFVIAQEEQKIQTLNNLKTQLTTFFNEYKYNLQKLNLLLSTKEAYQQDYKVTYAKFYSGEVDFQTFLTSFNSKRRFDYDILDSKLNASISSMKIEELIYTSF